MGKADQDRPPVTYGNIDITTPVNTSINVDAEVLRNYGKQISGEDGSGGLIADISNELGTIFATLQDLQLGWAGTTAAEAEAFFARLEACMDTVFGSEKDKESQKNSVIARTGLALNAAGSNYLYAEDNILKEFNDFSSRINGGGGGDAPVGDTQPVANNPAVTAISEIF